MFGAIMRYESVKSAGSKVLVGLSVLFVSFSFGFLRTTEKTSAPPIAVPKTTAALKKPEPLL
jgi:hypothetical protein